MCFLWWDGSVFCGGDRSQSAPRGLLIHCLSFYLLQAIPRSIRRCFEEYFISRERGQEGRAAMRVIWNGTRVRALAQVSAIMVGRTCCFNGGCGWRRRERRREKKVQWRTEARVDMIVIVANLIACLGEGEGRRVSLLITDYQERGQGTGSP